MTTLSEPLLNTFAVKNSKIASTVMLFATVSASILPILLTEVVLFRKWGRIPPEGVFKQFIATACVAGFILGLIRGITLTVKGWAFSDWSFWLLFLIPLAYGVYMSRYRTVKRWQKALDAESYRADTAEHARQIAEMQLSLLQAQIEPHFLYNTLASVQYLIRKDHESADFMLTQLIRYLRHAMPKMRSSLSTLGQEFELADAYLQIARIRMGGRLTVYLALPEQLESHEFPPLIIQTLVENALKHGLEPKTGPVSISVNASLVDSKLSITVSDTGVGLGNSATPGSGTGLANIRNRLNVIYPGRSQLSINAASDGGVVAQVTIDEVESGEVKQ